MLGIVGLHGLALALLVAAGPAGAAGGCRPSRAIASAGVLLSGPGTWNVRVCPDGQFEATIGSEDRRGRLSQSEMSTLRQLMKTALAAGQAREFGVQHSGARMLLVSVTAESGRSDFAVGDDLAGVAAGGACEAVVRIGAFMHGLLAAQSRARTVAPWFPPPRR